MKSLLLSVLVLALLAIGAPRGWAEDAKAHDEIDYLIRAIETSGARFLRNGQEYSAEEGAAHLKDKRKGAGDRIKTAEDFIAGAATKSMISGKPYLIKPPGGAETPLAAWLSEKLAHYRSSKK